MDEKLKDKVDAFLRQLVSKRQSPFIIRVEFPNKITLKSIEEAENNKNMTGPFENASDLMGALNG